MNDITSRPNERPGSQGATSSLVALGGGDGGAEASRLFDAARRLGSPPPGGAPPGGGKGGSDRRAEAWVGDPRTGKQVLMFVAGASAGKHEGWTGVQVAPGKVHYYPPATTRAQVAATLANPASALANQTVYRVPGGPAAAAPAPRPPPAPPPASAAPRGPRPPPDLRFAERVGLADGRWVYLGQLRNSDQWQVLTPREDGGFNRYPAGDAAPSRAEVQARIRAGAYSSVYKGDRRVANAAGPPAPAPAPEQAFARDALATLGRPVGAPQVIQSFASKAYVREGDAFTLYQRELGNGQWEVRAASARPHARLEPDLLVGTYDRKVTDADFGRGRPLWSKVEAARARLNDKANLRETLEPGKPQRNALQQGWDALVSGGAELVTGLPKTVAGAVEGLARKVPAQAGNLGELGQVVVAKVAGVPLPKEGLSNPLNRERRQQFAEGEVAVGAVTQAQRAVTARLGADPDSLGAKVGAFLPALLPLVRKAPGVAGKLPGGKAPEGGTPGGGTPGAGRPGGAGASGGGGGAQGAPKGAVPAEPLIAPARLKQILEGIRTAKIDDVIAAAEKLGARPSIELVNYYGQAPGSVAALRERLVAHLKANPGDARAARALDAIEGQLPKGVEVPSGTQTSQPPKANQPNRAPKTNQATGANQAAPAAPPATQTAKPGVGEANPAPRALPPGRKGGDIVKRTDATPATVPTTPTPATTPPRVLVTPPPAPTTPVPSDAPSPIIEFELRRGVPDPATVTPKRPEPGRLAGPKLTVERAAAARQEALGIADAQGAGLPAQAFGPEEGGRALARAQNEVGRGKGDALIARVVTASGAEVPVVFVGERGEIAGLRARLASDPRFEDVEVIEARGTTPATKPTPPAPTASPPLDARGLATARLEADLTLGTQPTTARARLFDPEEGGRARAHAENAVGGGEGDALVARVVTAGGELPVVFAGERAEIAALRDRLVADPRFKAVEVIGAAGAPAAPAAGSPISLLQPLSLNPKVIQEGIAYGRNRIEAAPKPGDFPLLSDDLKVRSRGPRALPTIKPRANTPEQPILNFVNDKILKSPVVVAALKKAGIDQLYLVESGLRVGLTGLGSQARQFIEIDTLVKQLGEGARNLVSAVRTGDPAAIKAATADFARQLNIQADQAFRPGRGSMAEIFQAPVITQGAQLGAGMVPGLINPALPSMPLEGARSLFIELSARRNDYAQGGTGGIVPKDPANPDAGFRLNVAANEATGLYRLLAPLQVKSIAQFEAMYQLPGGLNPMQVPFVGGVYPSLELRTMDYLGPNAGYFNIWPAPPPGRALGASDIVLQKPDGTPIELTPRQVSLLQEGILDPALFSEAGGAGVAELMRTFEAVPLIPGTAIQNANDPFTDFVPGHASGEPRRFRTDFELGASLTVTPLAGTDAGGLLNGNLGPLSKFFPLGFTPARGGAGGVFKFDVFPTPAQVAQRVTVDPRGEVLANERVEGRNDALEQSVTRLGLPPELQGAAGAGRPRTLILDLPSRAALPFTGARTWHPGSWEAVKGFLDTVSQGNRTPAGGVADPAIEAAVSRAYAVFGRQPIEGLRVITADQREALRGVVRAELERALRGAAEGGPAAPRP